MTGYVMLMFLMAVVFAVVGILIYRGKTNLIHDYHQTKVTDKDAYAKAFGKVFLIFPSAFALSGIIGLFGGSESSIWLAVGVLLIGLIVGTVGIVKVQKKHNGGVF